MIDFDVDVVHLQDMANIRDRKNQDGTVRWQVRWLQDGKAVSETFPTRAQAVKFRGHVDAAGQRFPEGWVPTRGWAPKEEPEVELTLRDWFPRAIAARPRASADNKARCLRQFDIYVPATLADIPMSKITQEMAGLWVAGLTTQAAPGERARHGGPPGTSRASLRRQRMAKAVKPQRIASPKTAHNVFGTVSSVMKQAIRNDLVKRNVFEGLGKGLTDRGAKEQTHVDESEFELVYAELRPDLAELAQWAFMSGMRFGEITALQWRDLDYDTGMVNVRRAWKRATNGVYYLGEPKGASKSRRTIIMDPDLLAQLRRRDPRKAGRLATIDDVEGFLFLNQAGERLTHSVFYQHWVRAVKMAQTKGLTKRPRFHDLRHSHATLLLSAGISIVTVSRRLGHSSVAVTGDLYGHQGGGDDAAILAVFQPGKRAEPRTGLSSRGSA